mmetsp:Transcript_62177/g.91158  ORF Transcript_62177/g.91158 Transcript_62177/m.91158 type:complete len:276 (-) Transcript_62177:9-836(-)
MAMLALPCSSALLSTHAPTAEMECASMCDGVRISWKILRKNTSFAFASSSSFSRVTRRRSSRTLRDVSSRMKQRVCLKEPSAFQFTLESMSRCLMRPSLVRKRTGTSLIAHPDPNDLKISSTRGPSSGQKFMMGCPMYSSAVYPSTFISVSLAHSTCPVPLSQCIAIGALLRKSSSSLSEGGGGTPAPSGASSVSADVGPALLRRPVMMSLVSSRTEKDQSILRQMGKSPLLPIAIVETLLMVGVIAHSSRSLASPSEGGDSGGDAACASRARCM